VSPARLYSAPDRGDGMGFYIRKSVSTGPFRFNLSRSGVGVSVGVKGFRIGSGPRGNYVHMGRGGLYYRASLGGPRRTSHRGAASSRSPPHSPPPVSPADPLPAVEIGDVLEMVPSNGAEIVSQITEKLRRIRLWPWVLATGLVCSALLASASTGLPFATALLICTAILTALVSYLDVQRKTVVIVYDLNDDIVLSLQRFANEFDKVASASRIWNIDSAGRISDWKRNAGAGRLITRKRASLAYTVPKVVKTNVDIPSIVGGRQSVYFFPDIVLIIEGANAGAVSYDDLEVYWNTTVFIESDGVPSDAQVVGHTWRFVNRNGGPDRRFNNNRQILEVLYQQMGLQGTGSFQKILHISRVEDRGGFDTALAGLRLLIHRLKRDAESTVNQPVGAPRHFSDNATFPNPLAPPIEANQRAELSRQSSNVKDRSRLILPLSLLGVAMAFVIVLATGLYVRLSVPTPAWLSVPVAPLYKPTMAPSPPPPRAESAPVAPAPAIRPSFDCGAAHQPLAVTICADATLSLADLRYVQAYQALRQAAPADKKWTLQQETISFVSDVEASCGLSSQGTAPPLTEQLRMCISAAYNKQRLDWISRLPPVALPEVYRPLDKHIAVQRDLIELGFLPASATADGVYGPATRTAIVAWQEAHGQTPTAFLSDDETRLISDAATAHRGQSTSGQLAPSSNSPPPDSYSRGIADWYDLKQWSDAQTGERGLGVQYWEGNRNVPGHASCAEMADKRAAAGADRAAFLSGCDEARRRLDSIDDRRRSDPAYKAGFSSGFSGAPLKPSSTLGPGMLVSPPSLTRP
jgi:uncharacterized protein